MAWFVDRREWFSFYTHFVGALVALGGLLLLVDRARGPLETVAFVVYGVTLVAMFASSTLHHVAHREAGLFRALDQIAIYLFIAGTYTPLCLLTVPAVWGVPMLVLVWVLAAGGIALKLFVPQTPRWVTAGIYLGLGWMSLAGAVPIAQHWTPGRIALLVGGGVVYSVGAAVYARKRPDPWPDAVGYHGLWHVFVLAASALHFALVWQVAAG